MAGLLHKSARVLVPPPLRAWGGLGKEVVWVGMGNVIHLFDKAAYAEQMAAEIEAIYEVLRRRREGEGG